MRFIVLAAAACLATPLAAQMPTPAPAAPAAPTAMMQEPVPDAERLHAARRVALKMLPEGAYPRLMKEMMGPMMDGMMASMLDVDLGAVPAEGEGDPEVRKALSELDGATLRQQLAREDPYFEERMRITNRVMADEMAPIAASVEPALRDGIAKSYARRFSTAELAELERYLATPTGARLAEHSLLVWMDPEVMKSSMAVMPEMMKAMPSIVEKITAATAHLPPPKNAQEEKRKRKRRD